MMMGLNKRLIATVLLMLMGLSLEIFAIAKILETSVDVVNFESAPTSSLVEGVTCEGAVRSCIGNYATMDGGFLSDEYTLYVFPVGADSEGNDIFMSVGASGDEKAMLDELTADTWEWYEGGEAPSEPVLIKGIIAPLSDVELGYITELFAANFGEELSGDVNITVLPYSINAVNTALPKFAIIVGALFLAGGIAVVGFTKKKEREAYEDC